MNRSGSTFFVTTLSTLPSIVGDYEINVTYDTPTPFHRSLWEHPLEGIFSSIASEHTELSRDEIENFVSNSPTIKIKKPTDEDLLVNFCEIKKLKHIWNLKYLENMKLLKQNANKLFE